jgi:nucleoside-diphosphate-sugar epimerase
MRQGMDGADGVFHIAGWYKVGSRDKTPGERINVQGTRNVLQLMKELEIAKGVYTSTLAVFGDTHGVAVGEKYRHDGPWLSEYDRTKWAAHYEVAEPMMEAGLPLVVVQPGVVYGPGDTSDLRTTFLEYLNGRLGVVPRGVSYSWAHVDEIARGHLLAMEKGRVGESYIIGGPIHTLIEAFEIAERITGIPAPKRHPGPGTMRFVARLMALVNAVRPVRDTLSPEYLRVLAGVTYLGDHAKAAAELGMSWRPLEEGLRETLRHEQRLLGQTAPSSQA